MSRIESEKVNLGASFLLSTQEKVLSAEVINAKQIAEEIIKNAQSEAQQIIRTATETADLQSNALVEEATAKAKKILDNANAQVTSAIESATKKGYETGYQDGQEAITKDLKDKIENVDKFAQAQFNIKKRIIKSAHTDIISLVCDICDKICHKKLEIDDKILENLVKSAIEELDDKENINIIVNPSMAKKIYNISDTLKDEILFLKHIKIHEDKSVSEDGVIVEALNSRVDSCVSSQISEIMTKLFNKLNSVSEDELVNEIEKDNNSEP